MKLLISDDSRIARKMMKKSIQDIIGEDIELLEANNGQEAIDIYKEEKPDICFMDLTMPVIDGFEATRKIKNYDESAKIIIVSADIQEGSIEKARTNGALGFIKKPINAANLSVMLEKLGLK